MQTYRNCSSSGEDKQALISIILMFSFYLKPTLLRWWKNKCRISYSGAHFIQRAHFAMLKHTPWTGWDHTHRKALLTEWHHWTNRAVDSLCHDVNNHHFKSTEPPIRGHVHSKFSVIWNERQEPIKDLHSKARQSFHISSRVCHKLCQAWKKRYFWHQWKSLCIPPNPRHLLFELLPSVHRYSALSTRTARHKKGYSPK